MLPTNMVVIFYEKQGAKLLIKRWSKDIVRAHFEIIQADLITGQDTSQWEERQWEQGSHCIRHRFGHPINGKEKHNVSTSCLLKPYSWKKSTCVMLNAVLTIVLMRIGSGSRTSGVSIIHNNRHERLMSVTRCETTTIVDVYQRMICSLRKLWGGNSIFCWSLASPLYGYQVYDSVHWMRALTHMSDGDNR